MEKKKCKVCGRELPLSDFKRNSLSPDGYVNTCTACQNKKRRSNIKNNELDVVTPPHKDKGCNPDLAQFTPRELMAELKARGFRGKLSIIREVTL